MVAFIEHTFAFSPEEKEIILYQSLIDKYYPGIELTISFLDEKNKPVLFIKLTIRDINIQEWLTKIDPKIKITTIEISTDRIPKKWGFLSVLKECKVTKDKMESILTEFKPDTKIYEQIFCVIQSRMNNSYEILLRTSFSIKEEDVIKYGCMVAYELGINELYYSRSSSLVFMKVDDLNICSISTTHAGDSELSIVFDIDDGFVGKLVPSDMIEAFEKWNKNGRNPTQPILTFE